MAAALSAALLERRSCRNASETLSPTIAKMIERGFPVTHDKGDRSQSQEQQVERISQALQQLHRNALARLMRNRVGAVLLEPRLRFAVR